MVKEQCMGSTYDRGQAFSTRHRPPPRCTPPHTWPQPCRIPGTCPPCRTRRLLRRTHHSKCWGPPEAEDRAWVSGEPRGQRPPPPTHPSALRALLPCCGTLWRCCPGWSRISAQPRLCSRGWSHMGKFESRCLCIPETSSSYFQTPVLP